MLLLKLFVPFLEVHNFELVYKILLKRHDVLVVRRRYLARVVFIVAESACS